MAVVEAQPARQPRSVPTGLGLAISAIALAGCAWWVSQQDTPRIPTSTAALLELAAAVAVYAVATVMRGWRWHRLLVASRIPHERLDAYALVPVTYMGNTIFPARAGELLRIVLMSRRGGARKRDVTGTVVAERLLDAVGLAVLLVTLGAAGLAGTAAGSWPVAVAGGGLVLVLAGGGLLLRLRHHPRVATLTARVAPLLRASAGLFGAKGLSLLAVTLAVWLAEGIVFSLVGNALDLGLDVLDGLVLVVLSSFLTLIPAAPAYAGTFDAAILLGLRAMAVTGSAAFGYALLLRAVLFVPVTLVGLLFAIGRYGGLRELKRMVRRDAR